MVIVDHMYINGVHSPISRVHFLYALFGWQEDQLIENWATIFNYIE